MRFSGWFGCSGVLALSALLAAGCGGDDDDGVNVDASPDDGEEIDAGVDAGVDAAVTPLFRYPVSLADEALGQAVLATFGATEGSAKNCNSCHGMTQEKLRYWSALGDQALSACLTDLAPADAETARTMIDCLRADPANPDSAFQPTKLGVYTTGAHLPWFAHLFDLAFGEDGAALHETFVEQMDMPRNELRSITQEQFDQIAEYYDRELPRLAELLPNDPNTEGCVLDVSEDVAAHVLDQATTGWRAVNADADLLMYGCGGAETARDCLTDEPRVEAWEAVPGIVVRRLAQTDYASSFWTRSSADGRFVGHGGGPGGGSSIIDLQNDDKVIAIDASYDPGFFPDSAGFVFQKNSVSNNFCAQSVLTPSPDQITMDEPGCSGASSVGLYQHIGAALGGGDYWAISGQFVSDDGGHGQTLRDPRAGFDRSNDARLTPMVFDGTEFVPLDPVDVPTPSEGDSVLSPSARLVISRVAGAGDRQNGFNMRRVDAVQTPAGYEVTAPRIARYCVNGGKPGFSYDERWIAYHHYVEEADAVELGFEGPNDPAFAPYLEDGAANIYLMDLLTGEATRVTAMAPGEYALFPHFRSDGWIYFMVRELGAGGESVGATDAALVLE
jgi:hypothetical protein